MNAIYKCAAIYTNQKDYLKKQSCQLGWMNNLNAVDFSLLGK